MNGKCRRKGIVDFATYLSLCKEEKLQKGETLRIEKEKKFYSDVY